MVAWRSGLDISGTASTSRKPIRHLMVANHQIGTEVLLKLVEVMCGKMYMQRQRNETLLWWEVVTRYLS